MSDFLVLMDIPSIKGYVFTTHKLKEIQGASIIIDHLNRFDFEKKLKEYLPSPSTKVEKIYANGGSAQFIVHGTDSNSLQRALEGVKSHIAEETDSGASLVWGVAKLGGGYKAAISEAQIDQMNCKDQSYSALSPMHTPFSRECDSCSRGIATQIDKDGDWLCPSCDGKRKAQAQARLRRTGIWQEFNEYLIRKGFLTNSTWVERPNDFTEIGAACKKGDYMAVVYADGNAIGRIIREIDKEERFRDFAKIIDTSIKEACFRALAEVCQDYLNSEKAGEFPADILLLGGDDLLVALPADKGLSFAALASRYFEAKTKERFSQSNDSFFKEKFANNGCTISLGIAVGKSHYPFRVLLSQAEELLTRAKIAGSKDQDVQGQGFWVPSYLDFHLTTQSHQLGIEHIRKYYYSFERITEDGIDKFYRTFRPYRVSDRVSDKMSDIKRFFDASEELKKARFPRTKLNGLYRAALNNHRFQAMLDTIRIVTRCKKNERDALNKALDEFGCRQFMPWNSENRTFITELVEFYDLIEPALIGPGSITDQEGHHDYL